MSTISQKFSPFGTQDSQRYEIFKNNSNLFVRFRWGNYFAGFTTSKHKHGANYYNAGPVFFQTSQSTCAMTYLNSCR